MNLTDINEIKRLLSRHGFRFSKSMGQNFLTASWVPEALLQGDHAKVARWRRKTSLERTMDKRPDMFEKLELSEKSDLKLLEEIKKDRSRMKLTQPVS